MNAGGAKAPPFYMHKFAAYTKAAVWIFLWKSDFLSTALPVFSAQICQGENNRPVMLAKGYIS